MRRVDLRFWIDEERMGDGHWYYSVCLFALFTYFQSPESKNAIEKSHSSLSSSSFTQTPPVVRDWLAASLPTLHGPRINRT